MCEEPRCLLLTRWVEGIRVVGCRGSAWPESSWDSSTGVIARWSEDQGQVAVGRGNRCSCFMFFFAAPLEQSVSLGSGACAVNSYVRSKHGVSEVVSLPLTECVDGVCARWESAI